MTHHTPAPDLLRDRIILITGAGSGLGRSVALGCARHGATVILLGKGVRQLEQLYDQIEQAGGPQPAIYPMNLEGACPKDYDDLADTLANHFGRLDGLLHNAAHHPGLTPIANYSIDTWYRALQVNLNAPFLLTQAVLPLLNQSDDASVLFTHDATADDGRAYGGAYSVGKAGSLCLMRMLASELEANTHIRVNAIEPGKVHTRTRVKLYPGLGAADWQTPEAVLPLYLHALGPDSRGITGQVLRATAGSD